MLGKVRMCTVLIVEKETMLGALYELELSEEGYTVILAKTAVQALEIVASRPVDLIVTAISGCVQEADAAVKNLIHGVNIPVILNTGYHVHMIQDYVSNRIAYVLKSSNLAMLKEKIKIMLAGRKHTTAWEKRSACSSDIRAPDTRGARKQLRSGC